MAFPKNVYGGTESNASNGLSAQVCNSLSAIRMTKVAFDNPIYSIEWYRMVPENISILNGRFLNEMYVG